MKFCVVIALLVLCGCADERGGADEPAPTPAPPPPAHGVSVRKLVSGDGIEPNVFEITTPHGVFYAVTTWRSGVALHGPLASLPPATSAIPPNAEVPSDGARTK
jgi:hypothetical protein